MYIDITRNRAAYQAHHILTTLGGKVYVVGGAVRDSLLGVEPKDIDLLVTGVSSNRILSALAGSYRTGDSFGVFRWKYQGDEVEIAMPRTEVSTGPGHKDFRVEVDESVPLKMDLARRDFTINAMAYELPTVPNGVGVLHDPHGGQADIFSHMITMVNPNAFQDDPLRILRAFVLMARFGFNIDPNTRESIEYNSGGIANLPAERIQEELDKIFEAPHVAEAIDWMQWLRVLWYIFPEVADNWEYDQNNPHHEQILGQHHLSTLRIVASVSDDPDLRLAALLHDIGKPDSAWVDPVTGSNHFYAKRFSQEEWIALTGNIDFPDKARWVYNPMGNTQFDVGFNHEDVGAVLADRRLTELKYPNKRIEKVNRLIAGHMWAPFTSEKGARRFLNTHGELADDLLILRLGDQGGKSVYPATPEHSLDNQRELLRIVREKGEATKTSDLAVNGHDLIEAGILEPGPDMGKVLEYLTQKVLDNPELNDKDNLLGMAALWQKGWDA